MLPTNRDLLAVADRRQPVRGNSESGEIIHRGLSALGAQRHVVFRSAALVAVTFNLDLGCRVGFEPFRVGFQNPASLLRESSTVEIKTNIGHRTGSSRFTPTQRF